MSVAAFATGGVIIDNMVSANGVLARDLVGGNAVYAAVGASHWLESVGICARIPRNYPAHARHQLGTSGLELGGLTIEPVDVLRSEWFFHRADGSRVDHLHASSNEADAFGMTGAHVSPDRARRFEAHLLASAERGSDYKTFRAAHPVTSHHVPAHYWQAKAIHLGPNLPEAQLSLAREARVRGLKITCDPGFHAGVLTPSQLDDLLGLVDAFLPSERELSLLCPGLPLTAALARLSSRARGTVGVKCGTKGAWLLRKDDPKPVHVPVWPVDAPDPTGAGDAFCGGYLAGLVLGDDALNAGLRGAVSASLAIGTAGAIQTGDRRQDAMARLDHLRNTVGRLQNEAEPDHPTSLA